MTKGRFLKLPWFSSMECVYPPRTSRDCPWAPYEQRRWQFCNRDVMSRYSPAEWIHCICIIFQTVVQPFLQRGSQRSLDSSYEAGNDNEDETASSHAFQWILWTQQPTTLHTAHITNHWGCDKLSTVLSSSSILLFTTGPHLAAGVYDEFHNV